MKRNPFLENFRPYIPVGRDEYARADRLFPLIVGTIARHYLRRVVALSGSENGFDRFGFDSRGGYFHHAFPPALEIAADAKTRRFWKITSCRRPVRRANQSRSASA